MKDSSTYSPSKNTAILVVGDPGSGKTRVAMALPNPGILDCDGNLGSAVRIAPTKKFKYSVGFRDDNEKEIPEVDRWSHCMKETAKLITSPDTQSYILDGLSNLCRWGLVHAEAELTKAGINVRKEYLAKYQAFIPLLSNFLTTIRVPGKLVLVTVHQCTDKDEFGRMRYYLDIPGRLAETLGGQFTDVWGMISTPDAANTRTMAKYEIRTKPSGYHINLKTSLDLEPAINVTDVLPDKIWSILEPKLSYNVVQQQPKG